MAVSLSGLVSRAPRLSLLTAPKCRSGDAGDSDSPTRRGTAVPLSDQVGQVGREETEATSHYLSPCSVTVALFYCQLLCLAFTAYHLKIKLDPGDGRIVCLGLVLSVVSGLPGGPGLDPPQISEGTILYDEKFNRQR